MSRWSRVHWSSASGEWTTPKELFAELDAEFHFTIDAAATKKNALCKRYWSKRSGDALSRDWSDAAIWCNPPYGRGLEKWIWRGCDAALNCHSTVVFLLPARTDTKWFHTYAPHAEIRFLKGRLKFGGAKNSAPFPSMLLIFRPAERLDKGIIV